MKDEPQRRRVALDKEVLLALAHQRGTDGDGESAVENVSRGTSDKART